MTKHGRIFNWMLAKINWEAVTALANVVIAGGVVFAVLQYYASERVARIDQTLRLMNLGPRTISYTATDERTYETNLFNYFQDRFDPSKKSQMTRKKAEELWDVSENRAAAPPDRVYEYVTARDELNRIASLAFA